IGGLVGYIEGVSPVLSNSYAIGSVSSRFGVINNIGGLVGNNTSNSSTIKNSIWDKEKTGQTNGLGNNSGTDTNNKGLSSDEMQDAANWAGWDDTIWNLNPD